MNYGKLSKCWNCSAKLPIKCIQYIESLELFALSATQSKRWPLKYYSLSVRSPMSEIQSTQERSILERIFVSPNRSRLRAGWRLLIQTVLFLLFGIIVAVVAASLGIDVGSLIFGNVLNFIAVTGS